MTTNFDLGSMLSFPATENQVKLISCDMLRPYHNHKFSLYTGERLDDMVDSIKKNGILIPIIVQPAEIGQYEILIGHNRWNAAKIAGLNEVPAIIKNNLSEDEAEMYVIESNVMQRGFDNLKISEQAEVLKIRHDKMFSQEKRNDIIRELEQLENPERTSYPMDTKLKKGSTTLDRVGEEYGMSRASVARLLRISELSDKLKLWIDNDLISVRVGVDLSYLTDEEQELVATIIEPCKLNMKAAARLRSESGYLTASAVQKIVEGKKEAKEKKPKAVKVEYDTYSRFFAEGTKEDEIQQTIIKALECYFSK